ncbi:MAG: hypothetical protein HQK59_11565 [Deltaproteobacteria bacterium]|nr:hypothetical protein [Deltaproteobacteria bacterium]
METLTLRISGENSVAAIKVFLKTLPSQSFEIFPELSQEWCVPYASDEEQAEIEAELKHPDCRVIVDREVLTIEI